ncbi:Spore coat polysaccharide biosynthesis protein SpsK [Diplonema papillatum]|nr:Spore coat polysaccharide biosynthesis protein SpsK [Diplonema papillatum]
MKILITGASGYIGGYLAEELRGVLGERSREWEIVGYGGTKEYEGKRVDVSDAGQVRAVLRSELPDVVVNCAAVASPALCEKAREAAFSVNCPAHLPDLLLQSRAGEEPHPLLIQLSTDQVYDGEKAPYPPSPPGDTVPINAYGESKIAFERLLEGHACPSATLRLSNVFGRRVRGTGKFLQFVEDTLRRRVPLDAFEDEVRSFVFLNDVAAAVGVLCLEHSAAGPRRLEKLYNCGGPQPLSRADFARAVARHLRGGDLPALVRPASKKTQGAPGPYKAPANIAMDSSALFDILARHGFSPVSLQDALPLIMEPEEA